MNDRKKQVISFVRKRLMYWQTEPNPHLVRADLANLRRGIGKKPGELPQLWELLFRDFPEELMSQNGNPTWEEWAVCRATTRKCIWMGKGWELPSAAWQTAMKIT